MNNFRLKNQRRSGFTLIELLVVIGIILILSAMIYSVFPTVITDAQASKAKLTLQTVGAGVSALKGRYDYTELWGFDADGNPMTFDHIDGSGTRTTDSLADVPCESFLKILEPHHPAWKDEFDPGAGGTLPHLNTLRKDYVKYKENQVKGNAVVDPWGHTYRYRIYYQDTVEDGVTNRRLVEVIYSLGPDGKGDVLGPDGLNNPDASGDDDKYREDDISIVLDYYTLKNDPVTGLPPDVTWPQLPNVGRSGMD